MFCLLSLQANSKVEETAPGVATGMILSLRERFYKTTEISYFAA